MKLKQKYGVTHVDLTVSGLNSPSHDAHKGAQGESMRTKDKSTGTPGESTGAPGESTRTPDESKGAPGESTLGAR